MRTNVVLEDQLVEEALRIAKVKTKKALLSLALTEYIQNHNRLPLSEIRGKIRFRPGYDYKKLRRGEPV